MATIKISELEEVTKLSTSDFLPIVNDNETKKVSLEQLDEMLTGGGIPEYVAEFGFNYNSSSVWWSTSGDAGSAIQAALQKALDNGEKYFKLIFRNTASGPPVLETYMYYNSSSNTLSQRQQYSVYTSSYTNEKMIYSHYVGSITDGVVGNGSTGYIWSLMTDYVPYTTTKYVDDSVSKKQDILTAGDNITIVDNVISAAGGGSSESSVPMFSWDFNSTDATVVTMFQEWWDLFKTSSVMYPISNVSNSGSIYEGDYWFPYMGARLGSNTSITITFINIKGNNTVYMPKPTIQYKLVTIKFGDTLANNGTVSSITVDSTWSHSPLVSYNPSGSYAQQQMDSSALSLANTYEYTPTSDYHPTTKKYVDDAITNAISSVLEAEY